MEDERRAVLERVARGEITPTEAASLLEELETKPSESPTADEDDPRDWAKDWDRQPEWAPTPPPDRQPPPQGGEGPAVRIRVVCTIGTADIIGDPSVREAVADGPHLARREGDMLVIRGQDLSQEMGPGFMFGWDETSRWGDRGRHRMHRMRRHHHNFAPLRVRVNPDLPLDVENQAGRLRIRGVHGPIKATVQAGGTDIDDFRSPVDLTVQAGSVRARGRLDEGASRIRCEAGSVRIHLERGSSVRVTTRATLGKVHVPTGDGRSPVTIGGGAGTLDIDTTMGAVRVTADE